MALSGGGFGRGRRLAGAAEGLGTTIVIMALVIAVVFAATRPALRWRFDLTEGEQYTLTEQTRQVLAALDEPVTITTIFRPEPQIVNTKLGIVQMRAAAYVKNLLEEYVVAAGGQLTVRHLDLHTDRAESDEILRRFNETRYNVVLVQRGERTRQVYLEEMVTIDRGLADPQDIKFAELRELHAEKPLTSALLSLAEERLPRVGFLVGQGEPQIDDFEGTGLGLLAQALRGQGLDPTQVDLSRIEGLPEVDVLVVAGSRRRLARDAVAAVRAFHEDGGALLLALDPWVTDTELDDLLADIGLLRERAVLTRDDPRYEGARRAVMPIRTFFDHPIAAPIARQGFVAVMRSCGGLIRHPGAPPELRTHYLARTDEQVFGDAPLGPAQLGDFIRSDDEQEFPRFIGFAVESGETRTVVFGGSGFLTNGFLDASEGGPGNMDLALNSVNWLVERDYAIAARPREALQSRVELFEGETQDVFLYVVVFMPLAGALLGLLVWFVRRR